MDSNVLPLNLPAFEQPTAPAPALAPVIAYESDLVTVYHGRAEHLLPQMRTESVDLVVVDPPYGVDYQSGRRAVALDKIDGDAPDAASRETVHTIIEQCVRLVAQQRHLYVFGPEEALAGLKVSDVVELVWDKCTMGGGNVRSAWGPQHERINFTVSKHRHAGKAGQPVLPTRMRKGSILSYPRPTGLAVRHPNEKPVALIRELLESSSRQGETVLDPTAGILSTAVAAVLAGRRAIVCESKAEYVEAGIERIKAAEKIADAMRNL